MKAQRRYHELPEFSRLLLPKGELDEGSALRLWHHYRDKIEVEWPTPKTGNQWQLTSQGYVGKILLSDEVGVCILPKVSIQNLFRMLEYAYGVDLRFDDTITDSSAFDEFYSRLASVLAKRIMARARKGLYRTYLGREDRLPYVRGRMALRDHFRQPWLVKPPCQFEEHTVDVEENQILAFTLRVIARSAACSEEALPTVMRAYQGLRHYVMPKQFVPNDCVGRLYNRLNDDYEPLHVLCRFFLASCGPTHTRGEHGMLPFLLPMATVFEEFVAEWLAKHLPPGIQLRKQRGVKIGEHGALQFRIDVVLSDARTGERLVVLDTKYKKERLSSPDFHQIHSYARMMNCREGVLLYPERHSQPVDVRVEGVRIRSLAFELGGDLEESGRRLLETLLSDRTLAAVSASPPDLEYKGDGRA